MTRARRPSRLCTLSWTASLPTDRRETIQRHLDECSPCFEAFGFEAELKVVIARNCRDEVPESLRLTGR